MCSVLLTLTTPSSLLAGGMLLVCVVLLFWRKKLHDSVARILHMLPLLGCIVHGIAYYMGIQEHTALRWFGLMYVLGVLIALWQFIGKRTVFYRIAAVIMVGCSLWNYIYMPVEADVPMCLHNYTYKGWTDSFISTVRAMEKEYPISDWKGIDYDALLEEFVPQIQEAEDCNDLFGYGMLLNDYCNRFYDGHVYAMPGGRELMFSTRFALMGNDYGLSLITLDSGEVVAVEVEPGSEAEESGIHLGTVVTAWDGVAVNEAKNSVKLPTVPPAKENEEPLRSILLAGQGGESVSVTFITDLGEEKTVTLKCIDDYLFRYLITYSKFCCQTPRLKNYSYKMVSDTCGYLQIFDETMTFWEKVSIPFTGQAHSVLKKVDRILEDLRAQGMTELIIDIRNNTGGSPYVCTAVASLFAEESFEYTYMECTRDDDGKIQKKYPLVIHQNGKWKDLSVVVLANQKTVSAGDIMAELLSMFPNVTLMGMTTSNGSCQATGGLSVLSGGEILVFYPVVLSSDRDGNPMIDTDTSRESRVHLEVEIPLDAVAIETLFGEKHQDYELEYAMNWLLNQP